VVIAVVAGTGAVAAGPEVGGVAGVVVACAVEATALTLEAGPTSVADVPPPAEPQATEPPPRSARDEAMISARHRPPAPCRGSSGGTARLVAFGFMSGWTDESATSFRDSKED